MRAVGKAADRMKEDRLRALRALRFAARFGFTIDPATWKAIVDSAPHLGRLSMERVKQELEKTMEQVAWPSEAMKLWRASGAFKSLVPPLASVSDVTLKSLDAMAQPRGAAHPERRIDRLTALFAELAPKDAERALKALKFSNSDVSWIKEVLERWRAVEPQVRAAISASAPVTAVMVRRWVAAAGRLRVGAVMRLARGAICGGARGVHARAHRRTCRLAVPQDVARGVP